ncbi:MAG: DUF1800 family protein [Lyngbya sp. HA4199-MV5]|nr:DUF1800 family protein [Lyngbya sp. HA4199-MV5]
MGGLTTNGGIGSVLNALFQNTEFWQTQDDGARFKTPYLSVVSTIQTTAIPDRKNRSLYTVLLSSRRLGFAIAFTVPQRAIATSSLHRWSRSCWVVRSLCTNRLLRCLLRKPCF